jgi:amino acid adenylation domain-containing protein
MTLDELLEGLSADGIKLTLNDKQLEYRAPKGTITPERLKFIRAYKQELIELLKGQNNNSPQFQPMAIADRADKIRASFAQERQLFLFELEGPASTTNNIPWNLELSGLLNAPILADAINTVVERHESLRTSFHFDDGIGMQTIYPPEPISIALIEATYSDVDHYIQEFETHLFDIRSGPLIKAAILRLSVTEHILLLTIDHIVADGWSMSVLLHELTQIYNARTEGVEPTLPDLTAQYADYSVWQRNNLQQDFFQQQVAYWVKHLTRCPTLLSLPYDRPRPARQTFNGSSTRFLLTENLQEQLKQFCQSEGTTLFMVLLTGFYILLSRFSGQSDICVGTPIANRQHSALNQLVGFFANTLALRSTVERQTTVHELLHSTKSMAREAYANQDVPFEYLVEKINPQRDASHSPIFQVMLSLQNVAKEEFSFSGVNAKVLPRTTTRSQFDMNLTLTEKNNGISAEFEYNSDLFDQSTIDRFSQYYQKILNLLVSQPSLTVSETFRLLEMDNFERLQRWNNTQQPIPNPECVHILFEQQVRQSPSSTAVIFENHEISYFDLNRQSNQLAHYLISKGIGPDQLVALHVDDPLMKVTGLLAILKAGAAYLPIDSSHPKKRIEYILTDSCATLLIYDSEEASKLLQNSKQKHLSLHSVKTTINQQSTDNPIADVKLDNLIYVIYTSGSTGTPKAVMVQHASFLNHMTWMTDHLDIGPQDKVFHKTPLSFDASGWEWALPLITGATLVLSKAYGHRESDYLINIINDHQITVFQATPSQLSSIATVQNLDNMRSLRYLFCGGEPLPRELLQKLKKVNSKTTLYNLYGTTETSIDSTYWAFNKASSPEEVYIGRPISNTQVYVLDNELTPVPVGVAGELYIGGEGLARGYLNDPALSAQSFIPDPFSTKPGARLYKSNDIVRYRTGGTLEYIQRGDDQVKIAGVRIEPSEIRHIITRQPEVRDAAVICHSDQSNASNKHLAAYVVFKPQTDFDCAKLRQRIAEVLPEYMLPRVMVELSRLPLTNNGKIDKAALPKQTTRYACAAQHIKPATNTQHKLVAIWAELLELPVNDIGITDNFFHLGGHSLLLTRAKIRLHTQFSVDIALSDMFALPTIELLSSKIDQLPRIYANDHFQNQAVTPTQTNAVNPPLSFAQQRLWFVNQYEDQIDISYNMPMVIRLVGDLDVHAVRSSINTLILRHEILRTSFQLAQGQPVQVVAPMLELNIPMQSISPADLDEHILKHIKHVFDLSKGPLIFVQLLEVKPDEFYLLINMHHIISDGWSLGIFNRELSELYAAYTSGQAHSLSPLPIQYRQFSEWQRQWLNGELIEQQVEYWKRQLANLPPYLALPTDKPRPQTLSLQGDHQYFSYDTDISHRVKQFCQQENVTLFMLTLAVFNLLLSRYSGSDDIFVGSAVANRGHPNLEPLIGFFVNMLVMRTKVTAKHSFSDYLQHVKQVTLEAYDHQDVPFESIVDQLQPERTTAHHPIFNVCFGVQNSPDESLHLDGLSATSEEIDFKISKYDLFLQLFDVESDDKNTKVLKGSLEYNTNLYTHSSAERLLQHFENLLKAVITTPESKLSSFSVLSDREKLDLLQKHDNTNQDYPHESCIHELFEKQVTQSPNLPAVVFAGHRLTYDELNQRANVIAHHLRKQGVVPETLVGIFIERSIDLVVAILAVLKSGGAYVPLNPTLPSERISFILNDTRTPIVLAQRHNIEQLALTNQQVICIDDNELLKIGISRQGRTGNLPTCQMSPTPDHLAYVIYTSGSTGEPKGVTLKHEGLVNLAHALGNTLRLDTSSRVLQFVPFSFDVATRDWSTVLSTGGTLYLASDSEIHSPHLLGELIRKSEITHATLPSVVLDTMKKSDFDSVKTLVVGGSRLSLDLAEHWSVNRNLFNEYGPTEGTVTTTIARVSKSGSSLPIGHPLPNIQTYILDSYMQPLPIGVQGELYIGGLGVARNYLNQPRQTAEQFVPNPFGITAGARLYRTGDLARRLVDGQLEFVGRIDDQVKVNGARIECGEIEYQLNRHEWVSSSHVIAQNNKLIAYLIWSPDYKAESAQEQYIVEQHIVERQTFYEDNVYHQPPPITTETYNPKDNFSGWNNSYDGKAIELQQMQAWADLTLLRIRSLSPSNVLEIGCGVGLVLFRLMPHLHSYVGSDISDNALKQINTQLPPEYRARVELVRCEAKEFGSYDTKVFDTIILNSVIQYFPTAQYLLDVIEAALERLSPGGTVFIGDVRHYGLQNVFSASVVLSNTADDVSIAELCRNVYSHMNRVDELLISPAFFHTLTSRIPSINYIELVPKCSPDMNGKDNELFSYRYDVILHKHSNTEQPPTDVNTERFDWNNDMNSSIEQLSQVLFTKQYHSIVVEKIPNARLEPALACWELMSGKSITKVRDLRNILSDKQYSTAALEDIVEQCESMGLVTQPSWARSFDQGEYDLIIWRRGLERPTHCLSDLGISITCGQHHNNPLHISDQNRLASALRDRLKKKIPDYMLPAFFVFLEEWPLTSNGKIDKDKLPAPTTLLHSSSDYAPAITHIEIRLKEIWEKVLGLDKIGINDNFFQIGGNSLLATRILIRIEETLDIVMQVRDIFTYKTISELAHQAQELVDDKNTLSKLKRKTPGGNDSNREEFLI